MSKRKNAYLEEQELEEILKEGKKRFLSFSINCKFKNKKQKEMQQSILNNRIVFVDGPAGTGKTLIALKAGLELLKNSKFNINQMVLTKPIVEIFSSKSLGALPGDVNEKILSYYTHFYDNLKKLIGDENTKNLKSVGLIKESILNFLRGSTFGSYDSKGNPIGSYCIFDESQNCTINEMRTFISRMGEESKLVIMGDIDQSDLKTKENGFLDAINRLNGIKDIGFIKFTEDDIVRDPFLIEIMKRYKK